jgi:sulfur relay (sulfurtransferase) DsrC/TusE family protein
MINVNGREIETDAEGYLASLDDWSEDVAQCLAERDQLAWPTSTGRWCAGSASTTRKTARRPTCA